MGTVAERRLFFEVFPGFDCSADYRQMFENVYVTKAVMVKSAKTLQVHIESKILIPKKDIYGMEDMLSEFVFQGSMRVKLFEHYQLSEQYTIKNLIENYYRESILFELSVESSVLYRMVSRAEWHAEDNVITLLLEDNFLAKSKSEEIKQYLERIFKDRFDCEIQVTFDFTEQQKEDYRKANEYRLKQEIHQIMEQVQQNEEEAAQETKEASANTEQTKEESKKSQPVEKKPSDFTDSIAGKIFVTKDDWSLLKDDFKTGGFYLVKGVPAYDTYVREVTLNSITGIKPIPDFTVKRQDNAMDKRVELHMHTVYSDNDSVVDVGAIISRAKGWGHKAIAITDHGVAQAFPVANHCIKKDDPFKIIYGVEGYFVDDMKDFVIHPQGQSLDDSYVVFDIETTGLNTKFCKIIEIGAVKVVGGEIVDRFSEFINPEVPIPYNITKLTSITDEMVMDAETIEVILPRFLEFIGDSVVVAHNAQFDTGFIKKYAMDLGMDFHSTIADTMTIAHVLCPELGKFTLDRICKHLGIKLENHHRAVDDAEATAEIFVRFLQMLKERGIHTVDELNNLGEASEENIRKSKSYHGIILAKNEIGRVNLNRLISASHVNYFHRRPLMPKSLIQKYREGLILGSACEAGELFRAIVSGAEEDEIDRIVKFYDYLEIQPIGNNAFMKADDRYPNVNTDEDLQELNRRIVKLGETYNKPVVATCDVHFLDPDDSIYRAVIMASKGFKDAGIPIRLRI